MSLSTKDRKPKLSTKDQNKKNLTSENLLKHLHDKIKSCQEESSISFGDNRLSQLQLLGAFMREDSTFLLIMQEMEWIRNNDYLLEQSSTSDLLNMILERVKLAMEVEYQRMKRLWEGSIGLLC